MVSKNLKKTDLRDFGIGDWRSRFCRFMWVSNTRKECGSLILEKSSPPNPIRLAQSAALHTTASKTNRTASHFNFLFIILPPSFSPKLLWFGAKHFSQELSQPICSLQYIQNIPQRLLLIPVLSYPLSSL